MVGLHSRIATDASVGAGLTFDDIDTVGSPTILNDDASRYYGFMFSGSPAAQTADEAASGRVRLTSTSLELVGEIWTYGAAIGALIATNNQGAYFPVDTILLDIKADGAERITSAFASNDPDPTAAWSVVIGHLHADKTPIPKEFWPYWAGGNAPPHQGGDAEQSTQATTTRTSVGAVTIEKKFSQVVGIRTVSVKDAIGTAAEELVGYLEVTTAISGIDPAHYPLPSIGPTLGTPVGAPISHQPLRWLPWYVKREEKSDRTIEPFVILSTAVTAADAIAYSLAYAV
jgi:hypothetical protein